MPKNQKLSLSLPESVVNIEEKSRSNLFTWRGQFSPQLIESLLKAYARPDSKVFDPFLGSGTVLYEAGLLGLSAAGCEINPAAISFAKIYELLNEEKLDRDIWIEYVDKFISTFTTDLPYISKRSISDFESDLLKFHKDCPHHIAHKILGALIVGLDFGVKKIDLKRIIGVWGVLRTNIESLPFCKKTLECFEADARKVPAEDNTFDIVVTSPPYINVFNYHQNYRKSVELMGVDVLSVARSEIGSNRKFRGNRFLTVTQYCMDMAQTLEEIKRVCKTDANILFIVGRESNVKKIAFYNAELLKEVACKCGFFLEGQQHRVFGNKFGKSIYEEILRFRISKKTKCIDAIEQARVVGIDALKFALTSAAIEIKAELIDAIEKSNKIQPSPYLGD
ncbi:MAG: DNA methyltransferase [Methylotenera sp.]|nr:DNA methyltransferase [Methylotenera sp.]MDP1958920.1 DNA methyltransferase [Methylotenera sp.]MDP3943534.1 DNA methyltransferase [Methylotenera sp.]